MTPFRTLQFTTSFEIGGTERHVAALAHRLDPGRFDVRFACLRKAGELLGEPAVRRAPPEVFPIDSLFGLRTLRQQRRLAAWLRARRIDLVHAYGFYPTVFALPAAKLAGVPAIVASIRDTGDLYTPAQRFVRRVVCRLADCVLVNAEAVRTRLVREGANGASIVVIPNGVELPSPSAAAAGVPRRITVVSRLTATKGIEDFLDAAATLARARPGLRFFVVGDGPSRAALEERARRLGLDATLTFTGMRLDVPAILKESAVSVLPSLSEALPNAVLESMAAGVPVVATRVGGVPELIDDGRTGLLVPARDGGALARAIARVLDDPAFAERLASAARRTVDERFSMDRMVRDTEGLYLSLLPHREAAA